MPRNAKGQSRAAERAAALAEALSVAVPARAEVCIVGAGASGLMAALAAAERGAKVVLLDESLVPGASLLRTGNGRCNFAASDLDDVIATPEGDVHGYRSSDFVRSVAGAGSLERVLLRFQSMGLSWAAEDTRLYPASLSAESVRAVLCEEAARLGVTVCCGRSVAGIERTGSTYTVSYREVGSEGARGMLECYALILASGGLALDSKLFDLALHLGLTVLGSEPVLCPLACEGVPAALDGRRARVRATLLRRGKAVASEEGEVLFREYGLSGIVVFNLSRLALPGDTVSLDLAPSAPAPVLRPRLRALRASGVSLRSAAFGLVDPAIAELLLSQVGADDWDNFVLAAKSLSFKVTGKYDTERAQVTRGGIDVRAVDPKTLGLKNLPGIYACGEVLDVDGPCGGYNLSWAWISGMKAGRSAAEALSEER